MALEGHIDQASEGKPNVDINASHPTPLRDCRILVTGPKHSSLCRITDVLKAEATWKRDVTVDDLDFDKMIDILMRDLGTNLEDDHLVYDLDHHSAKIWIDDDRQWAAAIFDMHARQQQCFAFRIGYYAEEYAS